MCTAFQTSHKGPDTSIRLCGPLPFDHYQTIRDAIDAASPVRVILDFGDVPTIPTWIVGYILHLEDSRKLPIRLKNANASVADMLNLGGLERLVDLGRPLSYPPPPQAVPSAHRAPLGRHKESQRVAKPDAARAGADEDTGHPFPAQGGHPANQANNGKGSQ